MAKRKNQSKNQSPKKPSRAQTLKSRAHRLGELMVEVLRTENQFKKRTMFFSRQHANDQAKRDVAIVSRRHDVARAKYQKAFDELAGMILSSPR